MASFLLTLLALFLYSPGLGKGLATTSQHWQHTSCVWGLWSLSLVTVHRSLVSQGSQLPVLSGSLGPGPAWERDVKRGASGGQLLRMCIRSYLEPQSSRLQSNTLKAPAFHCQQSLKFILSAPVLPADENPQPSISSFFSQSAFPPCNLAMDACCHEATQAWQVLWAHTEWGLFLRGHKCTLSSAN